MNRKWIGMEMGEQAKTHCIPRLEKVIEGEQGGISQAVAWQGGGGFHFCKLASPMFDENGQINSEVRFKNLAHFLWNYETRTPAPKKYDTPLLGIHNGIAYYLLYNGILGDKRPESGNVLTPSVLKAINEIIPYDGPKVVYGEACRLSQNRLDLAQTTFKQIPYDISTI
jgi:adenine-specific DNA-methyltransferase